MNVIYMLSRRCDHYFFHIQFYRITNPSDRETETDMWV